MPDPLTGPRPDLRLAGIALGAWLTTLWTLSVSSGPAFAVACVGGAGAAITYAIGRRSTGRRQAVAFGVGVVIIGVAAGAVCSGVHLLVRDSTEVSALTAKRARVAVELVVRDDPRKLGDNSRYLIPGDVRTIDHRGRTVRSGGRILVLAAHDGWRDVLPGQRVRVSGRLAEPRGDDLTSAVLSTSDAPVRAGDPPWYQRIAGSLRAGLQDACAGLPSAQGGLLPGLVVGDVSRLDPEVEQSFVETGMTHLTAVSGSNVAIVVGMILLIGRWCRAGPRTCAVLGVMSIVGFVILARPQPSVVRAGVMGGIALLALAVNRQRAAVPALAATIFVLVLADPALARSIGFALSVSATAGLLILAPGWRDALRERGVPPGFAEAIAIPAAAQAACSPLLAALSGTISLVAVPANLLAVPAIAPATILGVLAAVSAPISPALAETFAWCAQWPALWLVQIAKYGAQVPGGTVGWPSGLVGAFALVVVLLAAVVLFRYRAARRAALAVACAVALVALPLQVFGPQWPPAGWLLVGCDVGQGDALALRASGGSAVVIDAGGDPELVDDCLRGLGITSIPLLVLSHPHADHIGGLSGVVRNRAVGAIVVGPATEPAAGVRAIAELAASHRIPLVRPQPGWAFSLGEVRVEVLGPPRTFVGTRSDANNNSLVVRAVVGGVSVLFAGDVENEAQQALLRSGRGLSAEVLKVPHHGSAFSEPAFFAAVRPTVAVIEVGTGNDYGHPSPAVVRQLQRLGARVLRTDMDGHVAVLGRPGELAVVTRSSDLRTGSPRSPPGMRRWRHGSLCAQPSPARARRRRVARRTRCRRHHRRDQGE